jgi:hypothetical protein
MVLNAVASLVQEFRSISPAQAKCPDFCIVLRSDCGRSSIVSSRRHAAVLCDADAFPGSAALDPKKKLLKGEKRKKKKEEKREKEKKRKRKRKEKKSKDPQVVDMFTQHRNPQDQSVLPVIIS